MANDPRSQHQDPSLAPRQAAPPRTEQLIQTHKAWITAATGMQSRHTRRRPRHLRPLAISAGIAAAVMLLLSLGGGGQAPTVAAADLSADLIPTLGRADATPRAGAKPVAHAFRGRKSGKDEGRRSGRKAGGRREPSAARAVAEPAEVLPKQQVSEAASAVTAAPAPTPQVTDGRAAARPDSAVTSAADAQGPRTAAAPDTQH